jgi:WASH complex subunit strumpellin
LIEKLDLLGDSMDGFRRSFEYIQDYVNINGLRLWQEEVARVIRYNVEQECNQWRRNMVHEWQSQFQSRDIPIPKYPPVDKNATFMGRLLSELVRITDPKNTIYIHATSTWYDAKTKKEVMFKRAFDKIMKALDTFGLSGIDKMLGFLIVRKIQELLKFIRNSIHSDRRVMDVIGSFVKNIKPVAGITNPRIYTEIHTKLKTHLSSILDYLQEIGQLQLLRQMLANHLKMTCKFESKFLYNALQAMNHALLQDVRRHALYPQEFSYPGFSSQIESGNNYDDGVPRPSAAGDIIVELNQLFHAAGMHEPIMQIYVTTKPISYASVLMFLAITSCTPRLSFLKSVGSLIPKKVGTSDCIDGTPMNIGFVTFFRQLHTSVCHEFLVLVSQFVRSSLATLPAGVKSPVYPVDVLQCLTFLHDFAIQYRLPPRALHNFIPDYILAEYFSQIE